MTSWVILKMSKVITTKQENDFSLFFPGKKYSIIYHNLPAFWHHEVLLKILSMAWINNNTDRTLDVVFSRSSVFFVHNNPEVGAQRSYAYALSLCLVISRSMHKTSLSSCLRVFVNEKPLNLENKTSTVQSVMFLICEFFPLQSHIALWKH